MCWCEEALLLTSVSEPSPRTRSRLAAFPPGFGGCRVSAKTRWNDVSQDLSRPTKTPDFLCLLFCASFVSENLSLFTPAAETIVNVLDFKKDVGLWHGILTVRVPHPAAVQTVSEHHS